MSDSLEHPQEATFSGERQDLLTRWIEKHEKTILISAVVFHLIVLSGMIVKRYTPLMTGKTILLKVEPIDPRSLFRGEYVILSYEFSRLPQTGVEGIPDRRGSFRDWDRAKGRNIYVSLSYDEAAGYWKAEKFSLKPPKEGMFLKGRVGKSGRIAFGIESYFVEEGKGRNYEHASRSKRLFVEVAVARSGKAVLKKLIVK